VLYVCVYTPLKTRSPAALFVGAVSGAMPILMGYVAVAGRIDGRGTVLFALLYAWQLPHFLSIALIHAEDYRRAGILVHPVAIGPERTRRRRVLFGLILWLVSMIPTTFHGVGTLYTAAALLSGLAFLTAGMRSLRAVPRPGVDRSYFLWTLGHVPLLLIALILDAPLPGTRA
jgi:protoheme IX farnesyltransferase